jgi:hypothetical protein
MYQAFIYFKFRARRVEFMPTTKLCKLGESFKRLTPTDPAYDVTRRLAQEIIRLATVRPTPFRGTSAEIADVVPDAAQNVGCKAVFLRQSGTYPPRVLVNLP